MFLKRSGIIPIWYAGVENLPRKMTVTGGNTCPCYIFVTKLSYSVYKYRIYM
jgi:hypothetical protein